MKGANFILLLFALALCPVAKAQTDSIKTRIVEGVSHDFLTEYLYYDKAREMVDFIRNKYYSGGYDTSLNINEFSYELTKDLRDISHDEHIVVRGWHFKERRNRKIKFSHYLVKEYYNDKYGKMKLKPWFWVKERIYEEMLKRKRKKAERKIFKDDFAYRDIKILPGKIGYFAIDDFLSASDNRKVNRGRIPTKAVIRFLRHTSSIIIDLRSNTGGYIHLSNYFVSYFVNKSNSYFITTQYQSRFDTIPGKHDTTITKEYKLPGHNNSRFCKGKNIYILTSHATFSAAELTSYEIRKLARVEIVGEKTRGGGNGHYGGFWMPDYNIVVPCVKVFDKENGFSIEGKGIEPDIKVNEDSAFIVAYARALKWAGKDSLNFRSRILKRGYTGGIVYTHAYDSILPECVGNYRRVKVFMNGNKLFMSYDKWPKQLLIPMYKDNFRTRHIRKVTFVRDDKDIITAVNIRWYSGYLETYRLVKP